jgi:uncharacterized protein (DUF58 family)
VKTDVPSYRPFRLPRRLRVTAEGKAFLLMTLGAGAAAINTGNNLLYIAFCMNLSLIILSGILSEWCLRGVAVRVRAAGEAFARASAPLTVSCSRPGRRFPSISLAVTLRTDDGNLTARFPYIPPGGSASRILAFRSARRGPLSFTGCVVSTRFPFALFEKSADVVPDASVLVYPAPDLYDPSRPEGISPGRDAASASAGRQGDAIRGAREHKPADPMRDIHWKASARLGKWMVKEREGDASPAVDVILPPASPPEEFERLVSRACAAVLRCGREGRPYRIWRGGRLCAGGGAGRAAALSFLALARAEGDPGGGGNVK